MRDRHHTSLTLGIEFDSGATPELTRQLWGELADPLAKAPGLDAHAAQAMRLSATA